MSIYYNNFLKRCLPRDFTRFFLRTPKLERASLGWQSVKKVYNIALKRKASFVALFSFWNRIFVSYEEKLRLLVRTIRTEREFGRVDRRFPLFDIIPDNFKTFLPYRVGRSWTLTFDRSRATVYYWEEVSVDIFFLISMFNGHWSSKVSVLTKDVWRKCIIIAITLIWNGRFEKRFYE